MKLNEFSTVNIDSHVLPSSGAIFIAAMLLGKDSNLCVLLKEKQCHFLSFQLGYGEISSVSMVTERERERKKRERHTSAPAIQGAV